MTITQRTIELRDRVRTAWAVMRGELPAVRNGRVASRASKRAPYQWVGWQEGEPQWMMDDLNAYVEEGFNLNSLIYSATMYKGRAITAAPLRAYTGDPEQRERLPPGHPMAKLVMRPNPWQGWGEFMWQRMIYLNVAGNSFTWLDRSRSDALPTAMYNLRPDRTFIVPAKGGIKGYFYKPEGRSLRDAMPLLPQDVIHVKLPNPGDPFEGLGYGLSPIAPLSRSGDVDNAITNFLKRHFERGTMPTGLLKFKMPLDEAQIARVRARWKEIYGGYENWDEIGILDEMAEYQRIGMTFNEMEFDNLDVRNESRILGPFGVHPILLGTKTGLQRATLSNYGEARRQTWEDTLIPELRLFEAEDQYYLADGDNFVAYDLGDVPALQKDTPALVTAAHKLWTMGVPANQAIASVGLNLQPVPGGDTPYVPMNVKPAGEPVVDADGAVIEGEVIDDGEPVHTDTPSGGDGVGVDVTEDERGTSAPKATEVDSLKKNEGQSDASQERLNYLWKALDTIATDHEDEFGAAAAAQFEVDKREILALVSEEKRKALAAKASILWAQMLPDVQAYLEMAGEAWRQQFSPLILGVVEDTAGYWQAEAGLAFSVRNLEAEQWYIDYRLKFADPIMATSERELAALLQEGEREGWSTLQMQNAIEKLFKQWIAGDVDSDEWTFANLRLPPYRTEMISRTETTRAVAAGSYEIFKKANVKREWLATRDGRVRDSHASAGGQVRDVGVAFDVGGYQMLYPGDTSLGAPVSEIANCRCAIAPVLPES
mgnify:CR=1 FL=1